MKAIFVAMFVSGMFLTWEVKVQSAIETVVFVLTGHEINAPGKEWRGTLPIGGSSAKTFAVKQINQCVYELTGNEHLDTVDFSRVQDINLRALDGLGLFVGFGAKIINSPGAYCTKGIHVNECSSASKEKNVIAFDVFFITGDVETNKSITDSMNRLVERKRVAYRYFRNNYCKARAF